MALRKFMVDRERIDGSVAGMHTVKAAVGMPRRHLLQCLASATLLLTLAACAGHRSGTPDRRMGQSPGGPGGHRGKNPSRLLISAD